MLDITTIVTLKPGEQVLKIYRRYWVTYLPHLFGAFVLVAAPLFFMTPLFSWGMPGLAVFALSLVAGLLIALRLYILWHWTVFIVTTSRVVDIDQRGLFERVVSEASHDSIADVTYAVRGLWGTVFGYGMVTVQTQSLQNNLELRAVRDPKEVHHLVTSTVVAVRRSLGGATPGAKVSALLEAASELNDAEARAFLLALRSALKRGEKE